MALWSLLVVQGLSHVTTQLVLLGAVLGRSSGNELLVGFWFFVWLFTMALGFVLGGSLPPSRLARSRLVPLLFALAVLPPTLLFAVRALLGGFFGQGTTLSFSEAALLTLFAVGPYAFIAGMTLNRSLALSPEPGWVRRVMVGDGLGDALGGLVTMLWLWLGLPSYVLLVLVGLLVAGHASFLLPRRVKRWGGLVGAVGVASWLLVSPLAWASLTWLVPGQRLLEYRASPSGELLLTEAGGERHLWLDGRLIGGTTTRETAEEFAHFAFAEPRSVNRVLVVGLPDRALLEELLRYRIPVIDCLEREGARIELWRRELTSGAEANVRVIHDELGRFARRSSQRYDVIFLEQPPPNTLAAASLYGALHLRRVKRLLEPGGLVTFRAGDYQNLMSGELVGLLGGIRGELLRVFVHVELLPTSPVSYLASDRPLVLTGAVQSPPRHGQARWLSEGTLRELLAPSRLAELASVAGEDSGGEREASLVAHRLTFDRSRLAGVLPPSLLVLGALVLWSLFARRRRLLVVGMLGFATMSCQLLLVVCMQAAASVMLWPLLTVVPGFLLGTCVGGELKLRVARWLEVRTVLFALAPTFLLVLLPRDWMSELSLAELAVLGFGMALVQGTLSGLALSGLLLRLPELAPGRIFAADLAGAAVGALATGSLLLPGLGLVGTSLLLSATTLLAGLVTRRDWA